MENPIKVEIIMPNGAALFTAELIKAYERRKRRKTA